jgi:hypothetical protein
MGLTVNTPALGLYAWSPRPTQKPAPPRWFFGGAGRTPQYLRHRNFDVVTMGYTLGFSCSTLGFSCSQF